MAFPPISETAREDIVALFIGMFNAAPGEQYLSSLVQAYNGGASLLAIAQTLEARPEFGQSFPGLSTAQEYANALVERLLGDEVEAGPKEWATNWVIGKLNAGVSPGAIILEAVQAIRTTTNPAYADAKLALENEIDVAIYYSVEKLQPSTTLLDLQSVIAGVTSDPVTVEAAKENIDENLAGLEFELTVTGDTIEGNEGNDSITGNAQTLSALDDIDGAGGIDTLTVLGVNEAGAATTINFAVGVTVANVENLVVNASAGAISGADFTSWAGLESAEIKTAAATAVTVGATTDVELTNSTGAAVSVTGGKEVSVTNGAGTIDVDGGAGLTSVTTTGGTTVDITDLGTEDDTLTTVSISGNAGAATIESDALTDLTLANSAQSATITSAGETRNITLNKMTGGTVTDATATALNLATTGTASTGVTVVAAAATAVSIAADVALTLTALTANAATTLTVTGDSKVTLTALTAGALTSIDASASTSGMTITPALGTGVAFTGGSGTDTVLVGATTKAVSLGAGNDTATVTVPLGVGGTLTGGDGTDTLVINAVAPFGAMTGITGFETLGLGVLANGSYSATGFTSLTHGVVAGDVTFTNVAAGTSLKITASPTKNTTYTLADATGTTDSLALTLAAATAITTGTVTAGGVETIAITSDDTAATLTDINHILTIAGNNVKTITVTGDAGLVLTAASTALTSLDASGTTNADSEVTFTTGALAAVATLSGGAGADTLDATLATKAVTLNGNGGDDTLTAADNDNTINGGDGNDAILAGDGDNTISGGAGDDTIEVGTGANTITAGAGDDIIAVGASSGLNTIDVGAGTDTVVLDAAPSAAGFYTSVTGMAADDMIDLSAVGVVAAEAALGAKITLGGAASFANYLDAAVSGNATGAVNWFQFGGNTYVTVDADATATFADGVDSVIELVGLVDLSTSAVAAEVLTV
jgi:S-layer protein